MEKDKAVERLFNEYTDQYSRVTLNPAKLSNPLKGDYDSENQGLWTGEAAILLHLNGINKDRSHANFEKMMHHIAVGPPGLFSRHPAPFYENEHHNVSKDEYRGFAFASAAFGEYQLMREIIGYGAANEWFYIDDYPYGGADYDHLGAYRLPTDRGLYNIVAKRDVSLLQLLFIGISAWWNSRKEKADTSSKIMTWFIFKSAEIVGFESKILTFFKKRFDKNMKMMYNDENYMEKVFEIYFQPDHPFHVLIKGL